MSELEQRVVNPIEEELENLRQLDLFRSFISNSYARLDVQYEYGVDIDEEYTEVNSKINNIKNELPVGTEITVLKQSPLDRMVSHVISISSEIATEEERLEVADDLKQTLRGVDHLEEIDIVTSDKEVRISLDLAPMTRAGITVDQVQRAIRGNNRFLPTGYVSFGDKSVAIEASGKGYASLDEIGNTMLNTSTGAAIPLSEFATVELIPVDNGVSTQTDGVDATWVRMKLDKSANVFEVAEQLNARVDRIKADLPDHFDVRFLFEISEGVEYKLDELGGNLLTGVLILAIVLLFCVGYRSSIVITLMLPVAVFMSLVGLSMTEYGIQEISLAGFIISLGLIVDNGIVVTENSYKLVTYSDYDRQEAAIEGTASMVSPLLSSTLTTMLAFAPVFLMTSVTGLFLHSMVATIWLCLIASLIAATTFMALYLARIGTDNHLPGLPQFPNVMIALKPFRDDKYAAAVRYFIRRPWLLCIAVAVLAVCAAFAVRGLPIIIFPNSDDPYFTVNIEVSPDRKQAFVKDLASEITSSIRSREEILSCATVVGDTLPFVHTGMYQLRKSPQKIHMLCKVNFRNADQMNDFTEDINQELAKYEPHGEFRATPFVIGEGAYDQDVEIEITGYSIEKVNQQANLLEDLIRTSDIEGIERITNPARSRWFSLKVDFKEQIAIDLGITRNQVDQILVLLTNGMEVDTYRGDPKAEHPIRLRAEVNFEEPLAGFDRIFLMSPESPFMPFSHLVDVSFGPAQTDILHEDFKPYVKLGVDGLSGADINRLDNEIRELASTVKKVEGVDILLGGASERSAAAFGGTGKYALIIVLIIFGIFVLQFRSLAQPFIVIATIPLSFIGGFILLRLSDQPLSFTAFVGLTSLMGIVVNNAILLVDEGNRLRKANPSITQAEAAAEAGVNRFMPILLTSITSIAALIPLALGSSIFKALAIVVIGGLATSTFLTLLCVPVMYALWTLQSQGVMDSSVERT